jgi:hypothetical protein
VAAEDAALQMHHHRGPIFSKWRRNLAASVGARLLDDAPGGGQTPG